MLPLKYKFAGDQNVKLIFLCFPSCCSMLLWVLLLPYVGKIAYIDGSKEEVLVCGSE